MHRVKRRLYLMAPHRLVGRVLGPRVLLFSVPKAGTNLLRPMVEMLPLLRPSASLVLLPVQEQLGRIAVLDHGQVLSSHLAWRPALQPLLDR